MIVLGWWLLGRSRVAKRGQASVLGGVLFLMIAILVVNFLYEVYRVQSAMIQFDSESSQERLDISGVLFGDEKIYPSPNTTTIITGSGTSPFVTPFINATRTTASSYPISNMNFTSGMDGWTFSRRYFDPQIPGTTGYVADRGAGGGFDGTVTGSLSGPGVIFSDFEFNPPKDTYTAAEMNWTTRFSVDLEKIGTVSGANLTWARRCVKLGLKVQKWPTLNVSLREPTGVDHLVDSVNVTSTEGSWSYADKVLDPAWFTSSGWYSLVIELSDVQTHEPSPNKEVGIRVLLDDMILSLRSQSFVTDWYGSFQISEAPGLLSELDLFYTGHYNTSVSQYISIMDATTSKWVQIDRSIISTSSYTRRFVLTGPDIQRYISSTGVHLRVYSVDTAPFQAVADALTVRDYYPGTTNRIVITFKSSGGMSTRIVSLWVIDSVGHHRYDLDLIISPGETKTYVIPYPWSPGEYTFKAVTARGTVALYVATV